MVVQKTVIVTGASEGLGAALVRVFARSGWRVVAAARSIGKLKSLSEELTKEAGTVLPIRVDVANHEDVEAMVAHARSETGRIDVLINNAGIDFPGPIESLGYGQWDRIIAVNLSGAFYGSKAVFPVMKEQGGGLILNVSSVAGRRGAPGATAYCASKFGMTGLTQALMAEGKPHNIRASVVYPGGMDTGWTGADQPNFLRPIDVARYLLNLAEQPDGFVVNEVVLSPVVEAFYP